VIEKRRTTGAGAPRIATPVDDSSTGDASRREVHIVKVDPCYFMAQGFTEVRDLGLLHADYRSSLLGDGVPNDRTACTTV